MATALKSGYNPEDRTGDFMYQFIDFCSLLVCLHLLYSVHKTHAHSYQEEHDTLPIGPLVAGCVILGYFIRANFNRHPLFDTMFAISVDLEVVAMIPQLWMLAKLGGQVDSMTAHFVAATFISTVCTFTWWWWCAPELEKRGPRLLAKVIICGQMLRLLLAADFMYYYALSWLRNGSRPSDAGRHVVLIRFRVRCQKLRRSRFCEGNVCATDAREGSHLTGDEGNVCATDAREG